MGATVTPVNDRWCDIDAVTGAIVAPVAIMGPVVRARPVVGPWPIVTVAATMDDRLHIGLLRHLDVRNRQRHRLRGDHRCHDGGRTQHAANNETSKSRHLFPHFSQKGLLRLLSLFHITISVFVLFVFSLISRL
ncbi:hypothetical protein ADU59_04605 [Pararhizobium polonicum]|uniref:Uncharacterized protein n=1 Tax=Pararhizobium polonicum TaxID=1612624 RepID=A0A1C7P6V4_9HYPH|nr:hypothetical protein ADU59_04605 [Pararhizobium polonicum]